MFICLSQSSKLKVSMLPVTRIPAELTIESNFPNFFTVSSTTRLHSSASSSFAVISRIYFQKYMISFYYLQLLNVSEYIVSKYIIILCESFFQTHLLCFIKGPRVSPYKGQLDRTLFGKFDCGKFSDTRATALERKLANLISEQLWNFVVYQYQYITRKGKFF